MSTPIADQLRKKLTEAMKAKDRRTADVIRMLETKVMQRRTAKGFEGEVDDDLYRDVIAAYAKSMTKALVDYEKAGERGAEHVDQLRFEVEFCAQFLPAQLTEDQTREAVRAAIAEVGATTPAQVGRVIGAVMKAHKGVADAATVRRLALAELAAE